MYGHPTFPLSSSEFLSDFLTSPDVMSSPFNFPLTQLTVAKSFDSVSEVLHSGSSSSSGSYNSPNSLASCCTQKPSFMHRSVSSHSLQKKKLHCHFLSSLNEFIDSGSGPVRRVFSTGDLHQVQHCGRRAESPLSNESSAIIEGMRRACRYSPVEKKERIERYRTKRNLRNFNKKIKYLCRKTLADSRPRIRGRFIRNNKEIEKSNIPPVHVGGEEEDYEYWINYLDSLSSKTY